VPITTATAPAASTARADAGSPIPPAASTGSDTALRTSASQRQQTDDALYVTAGLDTLGDQRVSARIGRRPCRVPRADLYQHSRACSLRARDQLRTKPERERHNRRSLLNSHLKPLVLLKIEHKIHAKRAVRYPPDRPDLLAQDPQLSPRRAQRAEASRPRHLASEPSSGGTGDRRLHDGNLEAQSAH
jgi:hypothetical protein